jgi:hypothetical protein
MSAAALKTQLADARSRRSSTFIEAVYAKYATGCDGISKSKFWDACLEVRFDLDYGDRDELIHSMDMNGDDLLDLEEFRRISDKRSTIEQFIAQAVPFHQLVSAALPQKTGMSPLEVFRELSPTEVHEIVLALSDELEATLCEKVELMRESFNAALAQSSSSNNSKFAVEELKAGTIEDYRNGLSGRVGQRLCHDIVFSCFERPETVWCRRSGPTILHGSAK